MSITTSNQALEDATKANAKYIEHGNEGRMVTPDMDVRLMVINDRVYTEEYTDPSHEEALKTWADQKNQVGSTSIWPKIREDPERYEKYFESQEDYEEYLKRSQAEQTTDGLTLTDCRSVEGN